MAECVATIGAIEMNDNRNITKTITINKQALLLGQLQLLHNNYTKGMIVDKDEYKRDREYILKQLNNASLKKLITQTPNIYLKNYYATFLK